MFSVKWLFFTFSIKVIALILLLTGLITHVFYDHPDTEEEMSEHTYSWEAGNV